MLVLKYFHGKRQRLQEDQKLMQVMEENEKNCYKDFDTPYTQHPHKNMFMSLYDNLCVASCLLKVVHNTIIILLLYIVIILSIYSYSFYALKNTRVASL